MPCYIKIGDIKGNCTDGKHKEWIRVDSLNFGGQNPSSGDPSKKGKMRGGGVSFQDLSFNKDIDTTTPLIFQKMSEGLLIPEVLYEAVEETEKKKIPTFTMTLKECIISSQSLNLGTEPGDGSEQVSIAFAEYEITATDLDEKGAEKGTQKYKYSLVSKETA